MTSLVLIGAGDHARVLVATLKRSGIVPLRCIDPGRPANEQSVFGVPITRNEDDVAMLAAADEVVLINAVGTTRDCSRRREIWRRYHGRYQFAVVRDPSALIDTSDVTLREGSQVLAGAILQCGATIGENSIVNTGAQIDHDCTIGSHCHIAPGAVLCGGVSLGEAVFIGARAVVKQGIVIGTGAVVAMGAVVTRDVPDGATVVGVPARRLDVR